jgi:DNA polymerase-3 subunit gamma/tau
MLKILEDTPKHVYFILCTTDPQKLISTIRGRCQQFQVKLLTEQQMLGLLRNVCRKEEQTVEREILEHIVRSAEGHPRNALNILEQVIAVSPENRLEVAQKQSEQQAHMIDLCRALLNHEGWKKVSGILTGIKDQDPETIRRVVLGYCQSVLLGGDKELAGLIMELFMEPTYNSGFPMIVYNCYSITKNK